MQGLIVGEAKETKEAIFHEIAFFISEENEPTAQYTAPDGTDKIFKINSLAHAKKVIERAIERAQESLDQNWVGNWGIITSVTDSDSEFVFPKFWNAEEILKDMIRKSGMRHGFGSRWV